MDNLGDYLKSLENQANGPKAIKGMPLMARLDGRSFHTFTKGLKRPYEPGLSQLMAETAIYLTEQTNPLLSYTQSDEISLVWNVDAYSENDYLFDGRFAKLTSVLAAMATAYFNKRLPMLLPQKADEVPLFDCRVWQVPTLEVAAQNFLWREMDAIKNSVSMAAQAHFTHKELHKVNSATKKKMLRDLGHPWEEEPRFFTRGAYFQKIQVQKELTEEELRVIPEKHRPTGPVARNAVVARIFTQLSTVSRGGLTEVLFKPHELEVK